MSAGLIKYDVIIPLAKKDVKFVHWVVEYIRKNFLEAQTIYIITNAVLFSKLRGLTKDGSCVLIDENKMIEGLSFSSIRNILISKNQRSETTGWNFQQFLKMGFALTSYCKDYYLSWDSDTIPLTHIEFFKNGHPFFAKKKEYHERYFEVMKQVLNIDRQIDGSFIAEHMMFKASIMRELIDKIQSKSIGKAWYEILLDCTDVSKRAENIFSEFELYWYYCVSNFPNLYEFHDLKAFRHAGIIRGRHINNRLLRMLAYDIEMATFELYDSPFSMSHYTGQIRRIKEVFWGEKMTQWPSLIKKLIHNEPL